MSRLDSNGDNGGTRVTVLRQPMGTDGTNGFKLNRQRA